MNRTDSTVELSWANTPVPAARALENFSMAEVGDGEYVFFDTERLEYHTLNSSAFAVWQLCDGTRSSREITASLAIIGTLVPVEAVELAVTELSEAGLLELAVVPLSTRVDRRHVVKLAAAGVLGGALIPAVSSISAPTSANLTTCGSEGSISGGGECACSFECATGCCCNRTTPICTGRAGGNNCTPGSGTCMAS